MSAVDTDESDGIN